MLNLLKGLLAVNTDRMDSIIDDIKSVVTAGLAIVTVGVTIIAVYIAYKFFTADDDTKRKNAKAQLIYCIIGIVVLVALMILSDPITELLKQ